MANKNWVKGCKSPNPKGASIRHRRKSSSEDIRAIVGRILKRKFSAKKLSAMIDGLKTDKDRLEVYLALLPYEIPKQVTVDLKAQLSTLPDDKLEELYQRITGGIDDADTEDATFEDVPLMLPEPLKETK